MKETLIFSKIVTLTIIIIIHDIMTSIIFIVIKITTGVSCSRASSRRVPRGLFWTSVRSVALEKEQWQTWGL